MNTTALAALNPFGIFDVEAARLDHFFSGLDEAGWTRPSRCPGWTVRDVLSHLAGEELYNHACLNGDLETFRAMVHAAGITGGYDEFNQWCVRQRRGLPVGEVLAEWREANAETRHRMTLLGRLALTEQDAPVKTWIRNDNLVVELGALTIELSPGDFVEATVGRLPDTYPIEPALRDALRCLA